MNKWILIYGLPWQIKRSFSPSTEGENTFWTLKSKVLLEQFLLLNGCGPLQHCSGHSCNLTFLTFCCLLRNRLLWQFSLREHYVFFSNSSKLLKNIDYLLQAALFQKCLIWVGILLPPAAAKDEVSCRIIVLFSTKSREHATVYDFK